MVEFNNITEGFLNFVKAELGIADPNDELKASKKLSVCYDCPLKTDNRCDKTKEGKAVIDFIYGEGAKEEQRLKGNIYSGCGCFLKLKVRSESKCPLGKF